MVIQNSKDLKATRPKSFLLIGSPASGKSHLACTFPKPFVFDFDAGAPRLMSAGLTFDYETFDVLGDTSAAANANKRLLEFVQAKTVDKLPYRTVVLDTMTTWAMASMESIKRINKVQKARVQDYGDMAADMTTFLGRCLTTFEHTVICAHEDPVHDEVSGTTIIKPLAMGKAFVNFLPGYMHEIWRCDSQGGLGGKPTFKILAAKDFRYPYLRTAVPGMTAMDDPSWGKIAKLAGWVDAEQKEVAAKA